MRGIGYTDSEANCLKCFYPCQVAKLNNLRAADTSALDYQVILRQKSVKGDGVLNGGRLEDETR